MTEALPTESGETDRRVSDVFFGRPVDVRVNTSRKPIRHETATRNVRFLSSADFRFFFFLPSNQTRKKPREFPRFGCVYAHVRPNLAGRGARAIFGLSVRARARTRPPRRHFFRIPPNAKRISQTTASRRPPFRFFFLKLLFLYFIRDN